MFLEMLQAKIHRAVVSDANLNYIGSITIDGALLQAAGILPHQKVQVVNVNNGARFETYTIEGERHSGMITVNGAAARLAQPGDIVIILSYALMDERQAAGHQPKVVFVDGSNRMMDAGREDVATV